jgi:hypothetical protein
VHVGTNFVCTITPAPNFYQPTDTISFYRYEGGNPIATRRVDILPAYITFSTPSPGVVEIGINPDYTLGVHSFYLVVEVSNG